MEGLAECARRDLERFAAEVARRGARANLVGSIEPAAIDVHIVDSLAAAPHLPPDARIVDLGSGAGFPGVPIAIARPDLAVTLVEIRERRVHFLRHVARTLDLAITIARCSIDDPPDSAAAPDGGFDVAVLRAVASPYQSAGLGRAWVKPRGEVWTWSGPGDVPRGAATIPLGDRGAIVRWPADA